MLLTMEKNIIFNEISEELFHLDLIDLISLSKFKWVYIHLELLDYIKN